uniref:Uncharacterized protein n=1 Tax=Arion vulgaris TaxID=1028688 RepID=A0A0B6ZXU5_9EUPU
MNVLKTLHTQTFRCASDYVPTTYNSQKHTVYHQPETDEPLLSLYIIKFGSESGQRRRRRRRSTRKMNLTKTKIGLTACYHFTIPE